MDILSKAMEEVTAKASAYVKAYNEGGKKKTELSVLKKDAQSACDAYNLLLSKTTYKQWAKEGDPIRTAIRTLYVPGAKKLQYKTDDDNYMTMSLSDMQYEVNLPQMQATLGAGVFHDGKWFSMCEKLACIVANALNERFNDSAMFNYGISEASKDFAFPKGLDPKTDEGVVHALQKVFDAILFIEDVDNAGENLIKTRMKTDANGNSYSTEWQYIRESMTANGGVGKIAVCNTGKFTSYILHAMHLSMTNGVFALSSDGAFVAPKPDDEGESEAPADEPKPKKKAAKSGK